MFLALVTVACRDKDDAGQAKVKATKVAVVQIATEAYPRWSVENPAASCPGSIDELGKYLNHPDLTDMWGHKYVMLCGTEAPPAARGGIGVVSAGPDGKVGTADDVKSWE